MYRYIKAKELAKGFVYCRPRGGLNDMLCQMEKCYNYCKKYNRHLFINTDRSGFLDDFANYFYTTNPIITLGTQQKFKEVITAKIGSDAAIDIYPQVLRDSLFSYHSIHTDSFESVVERETSTPLTFDFSRSYQDEILVHEQYGGGRNGETFLNQLKIKPDVSEIIKRNINQLGSYVAIHIRNTDYKTDYKEYLYRIISKRKERSIVLCTDDRKVQKYAIGKYGAKIILTHTVPSVQKGCTLHDNSNLNRYETNLNSLIDLFILASARRLYIARLNNEQLIRNSGFSILAMSLHKHSAVVKKLFFEKVTWIDSFFLFQRAIILIVNISLKELRDTTRPIRRKLWPKT